MEADAYNRLSSAAPSAAAVLLPRRGTTSENLEPPQYDKQPKHPHEIGVADYSGTKESGNSPLDSNGAVLLPLDHDPIPGKKVKVPRSVLAWAIVANVSSGAASLLLWNQIVNSFGTFRDHLWPGYIFTGALGGCMYLSATAVAVVMFFFYRVTPVQTYYSVVISTVGTVLIPVVTSTLHGADRFGLAVTLLCGLTLLAGVGTGILNVTGYTFSSYVPGNFAGYVSTGNGLSGLISFFLFLGLSRAFDNSLEDVTKLLWVFFPLGAIVQLIHAVSFYKFTHSSFFLQGYTRENLDRIDRIDGISAGGTAATIADSTPPLPNNRCSTGAEVSAGYVPSSPTVPSPTTASTPGNSSSAPLATPRHQLAETSRLAVGNINTTSTNSNSSSGGDSKCGRSGPGAKPISTLGKSTGRPLLQVLWDCGIQVFNATFTIITTLMLFPAVGPLSWHQNALHTVLLSGCFQITNFLMRYSPMLGGYSRIPPRFLIYVVFLRVLIFFPCFLIPANTARETFLNSLYFQYASMFFFSATHGWCVTQASIYSTAFIDEKEVASKFLVIGLLVGCFLGMFLSLPLAGGRFIQLPTARHS